METKQEVKKEIQNEGTQEIDNNSLLAFANNILLTQTNRITKAKDTSIKSIMFEFSAVDLGLNVAVVDKLRLSVTRESINKIVCSLLGCSIENYKKVVIAKITEHQAFTEYNQEVKKMLTKNKHLVLKAIQE